MHRIPLRRRHRLSCIVRHRRGLQRLAHHQLYPDHVLIPAMPCRRHRSCVGSDQALATIAIICRIRVHNGQPEINLQRRISRSCTTHRRYMHQLRPLRVPIDRHRCSIRTHTEPRCIQPARFNCHRRHRPSCAVRPVRTSPTAADRRRCPISISSSSSIR